MREAEEVEGLRLPLPAFAAAFCGEIAETAQPRLVGVHFKTEACESAPLRRELHHRDGDGTCEVERAVREETGRCARA